MTAQIILFPRNNTFDEDITEEINLLLKKIKKQKVSSYFLMVSIENNEHEWTGHYNYDSNAHKWELLGGVEALKHHLIMNKCFKENEE